MFLIGSIWPVDIHSHAFFPLCPCLPETMWIYVKHHQISQLCTGKSFLGSGQVDMVTSWAKHQQSSEFSSRWCDLASSVWMWLGPGAVQRISHCKDCITLDWWVSLNDVWMIFFHGVPQHRCTNLAEAVHEICHWQLIGCWLVKSSKSKKK